MARIVLRNSDAGYKNPTGSLVYKVQTALSESGHSPGAIDGDFGAGTEKAVKAFQQTSGMAPTGVLDHVTWTRLTHQQDLPPIFLRTIGVTAAFEGHGYTLAVGNFDGAYLTWGVIGFTLSAGNLKKVFDRIDTLDNTAVATAFGSLTSEWRTVLGSTKTKQKSWANGISLGESKYDIKAPWKAAFDRLGKTGVAQQAQNEIAKEVYWKNALAIAKKLDLSDELGFGLSFDIAVQNGSMSQGKMKILKDLLAQHGPVTGQKYRELIAEAVARGSKPKYYGDALSRKMTFATGSGKVHGANFLLRDWGVADEAVSIVDAETTPSQPAFSGWPTATSLTGPVMGTLANSGDDEVDFVAFINSLGLTHFKPYEFLVKGGSHSNPHSAAYGKNTNPPRDTWKNIAATARVIDILRGRLDAPIKPTSVYRSPAYNSAIGGASSSLHMKFNAIDFIVQGNSTPNDWASALRSMRSEGLFLGGIGTYAGFVHVDTRGANADWQG